MALVSNNNFLRATKLISSNFLLIRRILQYQNISRNWYTYTYNTSEKRYFNLFCITLYNKHKLRKQTSAESS